MNKDYRKRLNDEYLIYIKVNKLIDNRETFIVWWNKRHEEIILKYPDVQIGGRLK